MDSKEFAVIIERYVMSAAVEDTVANLKAPPGRGVPAKERLRSEWYNSLPKHEAEYVQAAIADAAHAAVFGILAVLDGARVVDEQKGRFELVYVGKERVLLNPQDRDLHDLISAKPR